MSTRSELAGDVLVVTLDHPPVNSLGLELRRSLLAALQAAEADPGVRAVLVIGANGMFCGGADLRVLNTPQYWSYPRTIELGAVLDGLRKPVIAAIEGLAMGGGLELAMGCHWRIATPTAKLALPEVKLGLLPGGGGTIRLPRLVGVETATAMMLGGEAVDGRHARGIGLVDALAGTDLLQDALRFTREVAGREGPPRRARDLPARLADAAAWFEAQRRALDARGVDGPAARTILDCIEAGVTLPVEEATRVADAGTRKLIESAESKALRHLFFAERQAGKTEVREADRRRIERVALVGEGVQARNIGDLLRSARIASSQEDAQLVIATQLDASTRARLGSLHATAPADVPFATTGDFQDWQQLRALAPGRPVLALRFSAGRVVELAREPATDPVVLDAVTRLLRRLGKLAVPCAPAPGYIIGRLSAAAERQRRQLPDSAPEEVERRCAAAMAAEGQALLDAGIAVRASDIDVAMVAGAGLRATLGGPMYMHAAPL